jgi:hypothetical protein
MTDISLPHFFHMTCLHLTSAPLANNRFVFSPSRHSGAQQGPEPPSHVPRRTKTLLQQTFNPSTSSAALTLTNQETVGGQVSTSRGPLMHVWFLTPENPDENYFS